MNLSWELGYHVGVASEERLPLHYSLNQQVEVAVILAHVLHYSVWKNRDLAAHTLEVGDVGVQMGLAQHFPQFPGVGFWARRTFPVQRYEEIPPLNVRVVKQTEDSLEWSA